MADEELRPGVFAEWQEPKPAADNVVEFRRREASDTDALEQLARTPRPACRHRRQRIIDADQRTVHCGECGLALDPIWCLLTLVEYREALKREREALEADRKRRLERQQRAIAAKVRRRQQSEADRAAQNCQSCEGTGWKPAASGSGVTRCDCRKGGARLI
jgi:hypothetical protein